MISVFSHCAACRLLETTYFLIVLITSSRSSWGSRSTRPANPAGQPPPEDAAAMTRDYLASLPSDRFRHLVEFADHLTTGDADQRFELLLDLFVDGLAARARSTAT
jgi:hypothetical protein